MTALELADKLIASPCEYADAASAELRRLAELERDAARYRWLRHAYMPPVDAEEWDAIDQAIADGGEFLDAAIDAAMGEEK